MTPFDLESLTAYTCNKILTRSSKWHDPYVTHSEPDGDALLLKLSALANPHRLRMLAALHQGSTYVSQLARDLGISRPLLHMHLQKLTEAGLVHSETLVEDDGKAHRYFTVTDFGIELRPASIAQAVQTLTQATSARKGKNDD